MEELMFPSIAGADFCDLDNVHIFDDIAKRIVFGDVHQSICRPKVAEDRR